MMRTSTASLIASGAIDEELNAFVMSELTRCVEAGGTFSIKTHHYCGQWTRDYTLNFPAIASAKGEQS